jgi:hypothetical protein
MSFRSTILVCALLIISNSAQAAPVPEDVKRAVKKAFIDKLADPYSAQYTFDIYAPKFRHGEVELGTVCGTVNAKNQFGAYIGRRAFTASVSRDSRSIIVSAKLHNQSLPDLLSSPIQPCSPKI